MNVILNRILVRLEDIKREVDLGDGRKLLIEYGDMENRHAASVTNGEVLEVGPNCYDDYGYLNKEKPVKAGDLIQFTKYAPRLIFDVDNPTDKIAVINDEDVLAIIKSKEKNDE